ncbi:retrotransposon protein, putative, ty1-copia subclass [Tanacetum coccineum]
MGNTVGELHAMLIEYEKGLPKKAETPQVMMIKGGKIQKSNKKSLKAKCKGKANAKGKDKQVYIPKPKNPKPSTKEHPAKDDTCHHCKEVGYCKRNYPAYLAELIKKKKQVVTTSSSDVFIIELFSFPTKLWVYDTSCDICYYAISRTRGVVSVHRLVENGFIQCFTDFGILVSKNNVHYCNDIPSNGVYEIDMHNLVPNVNSIYNVSTKRAKHNLESTYPWHCRLAHISKKRIEKLQQEGLLKSTDDESFDQCVSCLSGKMTRKSFPHRPERATDLLGIIHTDVCGPLRHVSRQVIVGLILNGLTKDFAEFVRNYNMHNIGKTNGELHAMVIEYEKSLPKKAETPQVLMIKGGKIQKSNKKSLKAKGKGKANGNGKDKQVYIPKPKNPKSSAKEHLAKDDTCHHCKEVGHCKRNCPAYLAELIKKKKQVGTASSSDVFIIELFSFPTKSWVYDTSCGTHICNTKHFLGGVFKNEVENQLRKTIKALRSDRGGEYISQEFKDYLKAYGIVQQLTPPYTPQHNRVFKRRNCTLLDMVRSMMNLTTLPLSFWDYDLESTTRILNMVPTKKGCEALVKRDTLDKLQQRSVKCIFIGYPKEMMGYYFYFPPENKIVVARYADFFEKNHITQEVSKRAMDLEEIQDEDTSPSEITSEIPIEIEEAEEHSLGDFNEPTSYKTVMLDSESNKWIDAMNAEIQSMMGNIVWVLVDLSPGCKTVRSKWIFKKKTDMDGIVHTYKARLVAKGYTQLYGVDYEETFSPVADIRAIRILISIAAYYDYEIWQMDVKTAFLNGYLDEDIYMVQPEGFVDPNHPRKVCKLQRSIYGLKQASRSWNKRFDEEIKRFGFAQNLDEPCVYQKASRSNVTFLILYVDDIIIMGNHIPSLQSVKDYLGKCFTMKDLGEAAFILGIKIFRDRSK